MDSNKQDQYNRGNNLKIHGIPHNVLYDKLEEKVIQIFQDIEIKLTKNNNEECHHLGKCSNNKIVRFLNRTICRKAFENKKDLKTMLSHTKLGFQHDVKT